MSVIFPIAYFGSIAYYQNIVQAGEISFELHEHYVKQSLRNRMSILGPNGIQALSIPVIKPQGNKTTTQNILISSAENWQKSHWKAIETAYSPSPYFDHYGQEVKELIDFDDDTLVEFHLNIHHRIVNWLELKIDSNFTSEFTPLKNDDLDFRNDIPDLALNYNYMQVFSEKDKFRKNLSILDAVFNLGPMARNIIIS